MKKIVEIKAFDSAHLAPGDCAIVYTDQGSFMTSAIVSTILGSDGSIKIETRNSVYVLFPKKPVYSIVGCGLEKGDDGRALVYLPDGRTKRTSELQKLSVRNGNVRIETQNSICYANHEALPEWRAPSQRSRGLDWRSGKGAQRGSRKGSDSRKPEVSA